MLQNTFIHIPKVSRNAEIKLWKDEIHTWQNFLDNEETIDISDSKKSFISNHLRNSIDALKKKDYAHFSNIPSNQHWRLYNELRNKACFLDIETTGLSKHQNDITLIGIHSNEGSKIFMNGVDLEKFESELKRYKMIITFNGKCFDIPFIKQKFPDVPINQYHADLRFMLSELGFRGGLKNIEIQRGIKRPSELDGVDGFEAVRLWHRYQRGDNSALETLKKYLTADIENLRPLMEKAVVELKKKNFEDVIRA
jgi:uncharacterized protein